MVMRLGEDSEELREAAAVDGLRGRYYERRSSAGPQWAETEVSPRKGWGDSIDVMCCEVLIDFWWTLFVWCWRNEITPSELLNQ